MATKFYCRSTEVDAAPGTPPDSGVYHDLSTASSGSRAFVWTTDLGPVTLPTAATHVTVMASG